MASLALHRDQARALEPREMPAHGGERQAYFLRELGHGERGAGHQRQLSFGMLIGLSTAISQFVFAFGPGLIGLVCDLSGDYRAALLLCVALDVIAAAIVLRPPKKRS